MRRHRPAQHQSDFDFTTGGFRLDLKTVLLLGGLAFSWWDNNAETRKQADLSRSEVSSLRSELERSEKARSEVEQARSLVIETQRRQLEDSLVDFKKKLEMASIDIADLKLTAARSGRQSGG